MKIYKSLLSIRWKISKLFRPLVELESYFVKLKSIMPWDYVKSHGFVKLYIHPYGVNNLYGHLYSLSKYYNIQSLKSELIIQHGIFLDGNEKNASSDNVDYYISMNHSDTTTTNKQYYSKTLLSIGPYILYAEELLDRDSFNQIKSGFGNTLLVVLPHTDGIVPNKSIKIRDIIYSNEAVHSYVSTLEESYDTILILDFYKDFNIKKRDYFNSFGYKYCLAGNSFDPFFLSRLKLLIELSDSSICFSFGTHIGYFFALDKNIEVRNLYSDNLDYSNSSYILNLTVDVVKNSIHINSEADLNTFLGSIMSNRSIYHERVMRELDLLNLLNSSNSENLSAKDDLIESLWGISKFDKIDLSPILNK